MSDKQQDPWGSNQRKPNGPPEIDEALRKLQQQISALFGGKKKTGRPSQGNGNGSSVIPDFNMSFIWKALIIIFILWGISGIFVINPAETAVITRFGKYTETVGSGLHWIPRFIESKQVVNEGEVSTYSYDALMLTMDANVVSAGLTVQYRVSNPKDYLFNLANPRESLQQATASALRQVIGRTTLDAVLTVDREKVRKEAKEILVKILEKYQAGLAVTDVAFQQAKAPDEVREAFDDVIKAQEDEKRFQSQAEAYAKQVEPRAKGQAQRFLADAQAYKQQVVLHAQGEVARYAAILPYYQKAPAVTRERLYIDTIENVLLNTSKIIVDTTGSNNMLYLPLDKWMNQTPTDATKAEKAEALVSASEQASSSVRTPAPAVAPPVMIQPETVSARVGY